MSANRRVALVTGASRGIGKATALALAREGFDLALAARTLEANERRSDMASDAHGEPLPGSLRETAASAEGLGVRAIAIKLDLLDFASIDAAVDQTLGALGRIDVLVNNAIYQGPGITGDFLDGAFDEFEKVVRGNLVAQTRLTRRVLPHMLERGGGTVINMTSEAGMIDPPLPLAAGGWSFAHGATKAGLHRMAGILHLEYAKRGIRAFNLEPGLVLSESCVASLGDVPELVKRGVRTAPVEVPAAVAAWLCSAPEADEFLGQNVHAQPFCKQRGLLPGWPPRSA